MFNSKQNSRFCFSYYSINPDRIPARHARLIHIIPRMKKRNIYTVKDLIRIARTVRLNILTMSYRAQSAHTGGALSCVEILIALYFKVMRVFPNDPKNPLRDRLVFSKAHDAKALYAVLAERGYFSKEILEGYEQDAGLLAGHSVRGIPGIEVSAGSLGHGLSMAAGMAWVGKHDKKSYQVFAVLSDGECDEGSTWEAALFAGHHRLNNLIAIVDYNKLQGYGFTKDILDLEPFVQKWQSFRWDVKEINGHDFPEIIHALQHIPYKSGKPSVFIAHTVKGIGGVPKHVNAVSSQYIAPTREELESLMKSQKNI